MRRATIYLLMLFVCAPLAWSQECERNMLSTPNSGGYAKVRKGTLNLSGEFTIEFWMQSSSYVQNAGLIEQNKAGDSGTFSFRWSAAQKIQCSFAFTSGGREIIESASLQSPLEWNHVAVTFTPNDSLRLYINGVLSASEKTNGSKLRTQAGDSIYFAYSLLTSTVHLGALDEVRIWSVARTESQIAADRLRTFLGNEAGLEAYWRFDDDPRYPRFHDFTGKGLEGVIIGSASLVPAPLTSPVGGPNHPGYMLDALEDSINMGLLFCSDAKDTIIRIRNLGPDTVEIDQIGFIRYTNVFSVTSTGFPLPPGPSAIATVRIQANPTLIGDFCDTLVVKAKNVCGGSLRIPVCIKIDNVSIAFADSLVVSLLPYLSCDLPRSREVLLRNTGTRNVTVNTLKFTVQSEMSVGGVSLPFVLLAGQSKKIPVVYEQGADGSFRDSLVVTTIECNRRDTLPFMFKRTSVSYELSAQQVDFPTQQLLPGGKVTQDTVIEVYNTGTSELYFTKFAISGKNYKFPGIVSPAYLYPGDTARVRIRFESQECGEFNGELRLEAPTACSLLAKIPLSIKVQGPHFEPVKPEYKLKATCDIPKDSVVGIINRSGTSISLRNAQFLGSAFSFAQSPFPASPVDAGDTFYAVIRFAPALPGKHRDTLRFFTEPCGYVDVPLEGYWGVGEVVLSDTSVEFGHQCDLAQQKRTVTITNTTGEFFEITSRSLSGSSAFDLPLSKLPIPFAPGESRTIEFTFTPTGFGKYEGSFLLTFGSCYVVELPVRGIRERAKVRWSEDTLQFGEHCPDSVSTLPVMLHNDGYANVFVMDASVGSVHFGVSSTLIGHNISPGSWLEVPVTFHADSIGPFSSTLTLVLGPCGDTVKIPLTGAGGPVPEIVVTDTVIQFGDVRLSNSAIACIEIRNPSCIPIILDKDDITLSLSLTGITVTDISLQELPKNVNVDSTLKLCFVFAPTVEGTVSSVVTINTGTKLLRINLSGRGVEPNLAYDPPEHSTIEFGDLEIDSSATHNVAIINYGLDTARISGYFISPSAYSLEPVLPLIIPPADSPSIHITFKPVTQGLFLGFVVIEWDKGSDTIYLRGRGVRPGLLRSRTIADFGDVRVGRDSVMDLIVKGSPKASFPLKIQPTQLTGADRTCFKLTPLVPSKTQLESPQDSIAYRIQYIPNAENVDTADLIIQHNLQSISLPLRGRGVDAHLVIVEDSVDFGSVLLNASVPMPFTIRNDGGYPLFITGYTQNFASIFTDIGKSLDTGVSIKPYSFMSAWVRFEPKKAVRYLDSLRIFADAPEREDVILLRGKGTYSLQGEPDIVYDIDDASLKVGEIVELPVHISGADVEKVVTDTLYLQLKYDPTIAFVYDTVITDGTVAEGAIAELSWSYKDSTVTVALSKAGMQLRKDILLKLRVEALLGPKDFTRFVVSDAMPQNLGDPILSSGLFTVTDCGEYRSNILFKGPYSISSPQPNPASGVVVLRYELGLDAPVTIKIVDALGREVKTVVDAFEPRGMHQTVFSVDELPSGSYIYVISSLEYRAFGKLLVTD